MCGVGLEQTQSFAGGGGEHGGEGGGEGVRGGGDTLVLADFVGGGAEAAAGAEGAGEGADDHVDGGGVDVLGFGQASALAAQHAEGPGFVEDEAEFVEEFELDLELGWGC